MDEKVDTRAINSLERGINDSINLESGAFTALKESRHKFVDPLSNKTADRMQAVQDHANEALEQLAEVPGLSGETRQACAQNVREKLNEWGDSLDALQSHAAKEGGNVRTKVTSNVAKQRHQIDDVAKALEPDTKSS
ncbi:unnamed protein product [Aphanomyces euteiches]|uniref:Uncharacterized protein n=1 Tax=Aphanomyces euteiches TaxID=100861 RepID=A0A6G0XKN9_9STRA|nr:hypothetical protein Ae201684_003794 [Aphanomyces euteiches]KAH9123854.1 hypothetical protein AeMF1_005282 [Aphanomyces euteiches]KAH9131154.1 hypothetical protein AeNC1_019749 [Aphanomyces euteiches]KAH9150536.1 hypothetical protein AeRB84_006643 [Aphanomyces euteiches]KAH9159707.1 hypothetical protein LEN26_002197 [Aphanomyces euteiches]